MSTQVLKELNAARTEDILHKGRLGRFSESAAHFTASTDIDSRVFEAVIEINSAHVLNLFKEEILDEVTARDLLCALRSVPKNLKLSELLEDVHMNVEGYVISILGRDSGGMLNLAKSRNDQVATALRMELREQIFKISDALIALETALLLKARGLASETMPGYTHLQRAQPLTVGHYLLAHFDSLERDMQRLLDCYRRVNLSPMGAGALASSGVPIDRAATASILGFDGLVENSLDAVSSRDFATETIFVCAQIMVDLSRLAEELVLWTSREFSFAEIQDKYASTSSMMPQKKNPVVAEIARAKAAQVIGDLVGALGIVKSLPLGYNSDLQELTRNLWSSTDKTHESLHIFAQMIRGLTFNIRKLHETTKEDESLYATELADTLVTEYQLSFREAHSRVAVLMKSCHDGGRLLKAMSEVDLEKILGVRIEKQRLNQLLDPLSVLSKRGAPGSPNPKLVERGCRIRGGIIVSRNGIWKTLRGRVLTSKNKLESEIKKTIEKKYKPKHTGKSSKEVKQ